jgi:hypothetical protein
MAPSSRLPWPHIMTAMSLMVLLSSRLLSGGSG